MVYSFQDLENLELAYAITIHKSQGSEYPAVLLPMYPGPKNADEQKYSLHRHYPGQVLCLPFGAAQGLSGNAS